MRAGPVWGRGPSVCGRHRSAKLVSPGCLGVASVAGLRPEIVSMASCGPARPDCCEVCAGLSVCDCGRPPYPGHVLGLQMHVAPALTGWMQVQRMEPAFLQMPGHLGFLVPAGPKWSGLTLSPGLFPQLGLAHPIGSY